MLGVVLDELPDAWPSLDEVFRGPEKNLLVTTLISPQGLSFSLDLLLFLALVSISSASVRVRFPLPCPTVVIGFFVGGWACLPAEGPGVDTFGLGSR